MKVDKVGIDHTVWTNERKSDNVKQRAGKSHPGSLLHNISTTLEAGTQNIHGAAGLLAGIQFVRALGLEEVRRRESRVVRVLADGLRGRPDYQIYADPRGESSVLSVLPLHTAPETLADRLAEQDVAVRAGLHCAPLAHRTVGTEETGTMRFSASVFNTPEEAEAVLRMLDTFS